jgi:hypothetical protein
MLQEAVSLEGRRGQIQASSEKVLPVLEEIEETESWIRPSAPPKHRPPLKKWEGVSRRQA